MLYVFASRHGISELKTLCISRLRKALSGFSDCEVAGVHITHLIRFMYGQTSLDAIPAKEPLWAVVVEFAAKHYETLHRCVDFRTLVERDQALDSALKEVSTNSSVRY